MPEATGTSRELDQLLHDAVQSSDADRRDSALQTLIGIAEHIAHSRAAGHTESVAQSAVVSLFERLERDVVRFDSTGQLIQYLRRIALGKAVDRVNSDQRALGSNADRAINHERDIALHSAAVTTDPSDLADRAEFVHQLGSWLTVFPTHFHDAIIDLVRARTASSPLLSPTTILEVVGREAQAMIAHAESVVDLLPEQLRAQAIRTVLNGDVSTLASRLATMQRVLAAARGLSLRDRLIVEMREAGWEPTAIAERMGLTANHVRVVHHRIRTKTLGLHMPT